jgi:hypothetical protein
MAECEQVGIVPAGWKGAGRIAEYWQDVRVLAGWERVLKGIW